MNEVTKIHLGRQAFTISVDAHHELKNYLEAISKQVGDKDVAAEIELRMAELLIERGITVNKVILPNDVDFLKAQLGNPKDFQEDEEKTDSPSLKHYKSKRLFRDTDNAMVAGVASGLAQYFGIDAVLIRILFVIAVFITFGWAIMLYIVLWLIVPEAKTSSERLQMAGRPVNVESLKEIVERADVKGAAHRPNVTLATPINSLFRFLLKLVGLIFIFSGLSVLLALISTTTYILVDSKAWGQDNIFPVGFREHLLLDIAMMVTGLVALFIILFGISIFRRKWPIRPWVSGVLVGLVFIGLAVGGALAADVYPNIRDSYNDNVHNTVRSEPTFTNVNLDNANVVGINFQPSSKYYVDLNYYGHPNLASVKTYVKRGVLYIDSNEFNWNRNCHTICIPSTYHMNVTIYSPNALQLENQNNFFQPGPPTPPTTPK